MHPIPPERRIVDHADARPRPGEPISVLVSGCDVLVVGGGLAGLTCAVELVGAGRSVMVLEADDRPGGRVRTDTVDDFRIDRGFQTLLTSYPEVRRALDLAALDAGAFRSGAIVRRRGAFHSFGDPRRHPESAWSTLRAPVGTLLDRWRMARLDGWLQRRVTEGRGQEPSLDALVEAGFSGDMVEAFLRPFLAGVFLERELATPLRHLAFVWRMFSTGRAVLPATGMEAVPAQLAARLPEGAVRCGARVVQVEPGAVTLATGERLGAGAVVVAVEGPTAARLLEDRTHHRPWRSVACLSFEAPEPPVDGPWLVLDGDGDGPVNNLCCPSAVAAGYAPPGRALVSASVLGGAAGDDDGTLEAAVRAQLESWYGSRVHDWRTLRIDRVARALPVVSEARRPRLPRRLHVAGDHLDLPSIHHAMASGRRAARDVLAEQGEARALPA